MFRQEKKMSCGAACARRLLHEAGVDLPESTICAAASFSEDDGIWPEDLAAALTLLNPKQPYAGGGIDPPKLERLLSRVPFIAMLDEHYVIVDSANSERVFVRDPAGGYDCEMERSRFEELWKRGFHRAIIRS